MLRLWLAPGSLGRLVRTEMGPTPALRWAWDLAFLTDSQAAIENHCCRQTKQLWLNRLHNSLLNFVCLCVCVCATFILNAVLGSFCPSTSYTSISAFLKEVMPVRPHRAEHTLLGPLSDYLFHQRLCMLQLLIFHPASPFWRVNSLRKTK